jgi:hypothetical protein
MKSEMHIGTWQEEDRHFMMDDNLFHTARKGTSSLLYLTCFLISPVRAFSTAFFMTVLEFIAPDN